MARSVPSAVPAPVPGAFADSVGADLPAWEAEETVPIPKWLMVLAARGELTLRVAMDLENYPLGAPDDTNPR